MKPLCICCSQVSTNENMKLASWHIKQNGKPYNKLISLKSPHKYFNKQPLDLIVHQENPVRNSLENVGVRNSSVSTK
ncbi:hypothetical protein AHF37_10558 [Paragonimus kellicotti]|nr:hypothetical protein AHF37_10558 [Paragonimus kellicotti]